MTRLPAVLVDKEVDVPLTVEEAFALFTRNLDLWWPQSGPQLRLDPVMGGDISEIGPDGHRICRGRIIAFDPSGFLAFAWSPTAAPEHETIVTVVFTPTDTGCRVTLTQGDPTILGPVADAVSTTRLSDLRLVLGCFAACAGQVTVAA